MTKEHDIMGGEIGFTLIEALLVLIILGMLAVFAMPYYQGIQNDAKISVTKGTLSAIRGGIELAHAKIIASGQNTGTSGDNPDWPTLSEVRANKLILVTRPSTIKDRFLVRSNNSSFENNKLPSVLLPDMTNVMVQNEGDVRGSSFADIRIFPRIATETTGWAYYPGNERDENGRIVSAVFYINDDRSDTNNRDGAERVPSMW